MKISILKQYWNFILLFPTFSRSPGKYVTRSWEVWCGDRFQGKVLSRIWNLTKCQIMLLNQIGVRKAKLIVCHFCLRCFGNVFGIFQKTMFSLYKNVCSIWTNQNEKEKRKKRKLHLFKETPGEDAVLSEYFNNLIIVLQRAVDSGVPVDSYGFHCLYCILARYLHKWECYLTGIYESDV